MDHKDSDEEKILENVLGKICNIEEKKVKAPEIPKPAPLKISSEEEAIINKIYKKFNITKDLDLNEPIDLVYMYVNYNDSEYASKIEKEKQTKSLLKTQNFNDKYSKFLAKYLEERNTLYYDFFLNLEITRTNLSFVRNIFIISPTPFMLNEVYFEDKRIQVITFEELYGIDSFNKIYFRPNNVIYQLNKIKQLSNTFLFSCSDFIVCNSIPKDYFFTGNIPIIYLKKKKSINVVKCLKNLEEFNSNKFFTDKFILELEFVNTNQITVVRKDVIELTKKVFDVRNMFKDCIDFLLLQNMVGQFLNLYHLNQDNNNFSGFYKDNSKNPWEKFNLVKHKNVQFFNVNYLNDIFLNYYLHSYFQNIGVLEPLKSVIFLLDKNLKEYIYEFPKIEKQLEDSENEVSFFLYFEGDQPLETNEKFGENLYINICETINETKKWDNMKNMVIELRLDKFSLFVPDLYFFMNRKYTKKYNEPNNKYSGDNIRITFPKDKMVHLNEKTNVPYTKILNMNIVKEDTANIKVGKILFK